MPGKQAKILAADQIDNLLLFVETTRYPLRDRVIVLLSVKAGLRAAEIANLTWEMVLDPNGAISAVLELRDHAAKKGHGRIIPIQVAEHSSRGRPGLYIRPVVLCAMSNCLLVIARSRPPKATSMATVTPSGGWYP